MTIVAALREDSPIQFIRGVGPVRAEQLATLGLRTVSDLLHYFPYRYESEFGETDIAQLVPDQSFTVRGEVTRVSRTREMAVAEIADDTGSVRLRWFQVHMAPPGLTRGAIVIATGRVREYQWKHELVQPSVSVFASQSLLMQRRRAARMFGVYRGNAHVKTATIRRAVEGALAQGRLPVRDALPRRLGAARGLIAREEAIRWLHQPPTTEALEKARRRLAYEELLLVELALALRRRKRLSAQVGRKLALTPEIDARIRARFPFTLTAAQDAVVREIVQDLSSGVPMTRLLQGDVGSGKTVVALYACLAAVAHRAQAAIMAPTEILAQQHFHNIEKYLAGSRVRRILLAGRGKKSERDAALRRIEAGEIDLVVGTQALIQQDVAFRDLALVVVDEQHKFGVMQRHQFRTKGPAPHYLIMTATPIPRTLAMTVFGDLDVSVIKSSPPGRGRIATRVVPLEKLPTVLAYARGRIEAGEQCYVVCPQVGAPDVREEARSNTPAGRGGVTPADVPADPYLHAKATYEALSAGPWRGLKLGLLHGSITSVQKATTLRDFSENRTQALVATTVVEVGVDVPNASIMVIFHADRYGLAQLHQLRGRIGRGARDSLCVFVCHDLTDGALARLDVLRQTHDGFRIAEADLRQRGPGELLGTRQHGLPELRVADILRDFSLVEAARDDAFAIVRADPQLSQPDHAALIPALRALFQGKLELIDAA